MALTNLVKEMAASKVSNEMLSEKIGVHRNTIANRLSGVGKFTLTTIYWGIDLDTPKILAMKAIICKYNSFIYYSIKILQFFVFKYFL